MMKYLGYLILSAFLSNKAFAEVSIKWKNLGTESILHIDLAESLTEKQKKLIYSGFSTFSHLEVRWNENETRRTLLYISECTIKYDMWEEKFDLLHFLDKRRDNSLQNFQQYIDLCLKADIKNQANLNTLAQRSAKLEIKLDLSQVSTEFSQDVRGWLISQQSGVMRGLFSHMLGDLKLSESLQSEISIPPRPVQGPPQGSLPPQKGAQRGF